MSSRTILLTVFSAAAFLAADCQTFGAQPDPWTGFYGGVSGDYGFGDAGSRLDFVRGGALYRLPPESPSTYGAGRSGFLGGVQAGYNWRVDRFVLGSELDLSAGTIRSDAAGGGISSGPHHLPFSVTEGSALDRLVTLRGQAGYLAMDGLLLYGFGGAAAGRVENDTGLNFVGGAHYDGGRSQTQFGWTAGAGAEYLFAPSWGLKLEYLHYGLGQATANAYRPELSAYHTQSSFGMSGDLVRVAVDYHLGDAWRVADAVGDDEGALSSVIAALTQMKYEAGIRYWHSGGTMRYSLLRQGGGLTSRLSYTDLDAHAGEVFARVDHPSGIYAKAVLGAGSVVDGKLTDEDFPPAIDPASRTESSQHDGALSYVTADAGYTVFERDGFQIAPFVGYAYYHDQLNAYGCGQVESSAICNAVSPAALTISEDADWNAIRLGLAGRWATSWHGLRFGLEGAWLPYGQIDGNDDHWLRLHTARSNSFAGPIQQTGIGRGMQFEATAIMPLTDRIDVGVGGRYWYLYSHGASIFHDTFTASTPFGAPPGTDFSTRRVGAFAQVSVHF
jgi:opacity protein-like surface antigen